ncbi:PLP-dependent aminotransferase family protein [Streptomyces sp. NPDC057137]|uniref:MocR-like pyridoxine biosynthesis transcription factor PdxR n=1 Tax=Streptomyces sp. NPDC057137 TaxID=3346030 RepID=UPI00363263ED
MPHPRTDPAWGTLLDLGERAAGPLHLRLVRALRAAVVDGRIAPGSALPPSRSLAADLGCSRWVVTEAYAQLVAEGYFEARGGSATRVRTETAGRAPSYERRAQQALWKPEFDMLPGMPDLREFPRKRWADAVRDATGTLTPTDFGYPDPAGHHALRERIAAYLVRGRGAALDAGQLVVCGGTLDGVLRLSRALRAAGHTHVALEDPGWSRLRTAVTAAGLTVVATPVDDDGLRVDLLRREPHVRAVIVAPAHQFPTGVVLSPPRRAELIAWARETDGLIMEDDYDAEFRYDRHPVGTLQGMAPERVALLGSLSKTLSPALRIGWTVVPPGVTGLLDGLYAADAVGSPPPVIDQAAFSRFLESGAYDRHLRASRLRYRRRRDSLLTEIAERLPEHRVSGAAAGFHLLLHLTGCVAGDVVRGAARREVRLADLAEYTAGGVATPGGGALVIGYGNLADPSLPEAVRRLADAIREAGGPAGPVGRVGPAGPAGPAH